MNIKKAIIIGASSGIGKGISLELIKKGYKIAISARRKERLNEIKIIKTNKSVKIKSFGLPKKQYSGLISNTDLKGFRVVRSDFSYDKVGASIHRNLIDVLKLGSDSKVSVNV